MTELEDLMMMSLIVQDYDVRDVIYIENPLKPLGYYIDEYGNMIDQDVILQFIEKYPR